MGILSLNNPYTIYSVKAENLGIKNWYMSLLETTEIGCKTVVVMLYEPNLGFFLVHIRYIFKVDRKWEGMTMLTCF